MGQKFHKVDVENYLKVLCKQLKRIPTVADIEMEHSFDHAFPSYSTVVHYFGGIPKWLEYYLDTEVMGQGDLFPDVHLQKAQGTLF